MKSSLAIRSPHAGTVTPMGRRSIQPKLMVNIPGDHYEQEADVMANRVMRTPFTGTTVPLTGMIGTSVQRTYTPGTARTLQGSSSLLSSINSSRGGGFSLPNSTRGFMESAFSADFSNVRVHTGSQAVALSNSINAAAFTYGHDLYFNSGQYNPESAAGRKLLAHELTHVVQQENGGAANHIQRQEAETVPPNAQAIRDALANPDGIAAVSDFKSVSSALNGLSMSDMLNTFEYLHNHHFLELISAHRDQISGVDMNRINVAIDTVLMAHSNTTNFTQADADRYAGSIKVISNNQQEELLGYVKQVKNLTPEAEENLTAIAMSMMSTTMTVNPALTGVTGEIKPLPKTPPGKQPEPFYIGHEAHKGIAAAYVLTHPTDVVRTNSFPIMSILRDLTSMGVSVKSPLTDVGNLLLRPDIFNLNKLHLYEIKPLTYATLAATTAARYVAIFAAAGVKVTLGPTTEPGLTGALPAPGGVYLYESPAPGVILYQYTRQQILRVPEIVGVPIVGRRFELKPLPEHQQRALTNGITLAALFVVLALGLLLAFA